MFKKILYPTDFSDVAYKVLDFIVQLKTAGTKEVLLLHVIDQRDVYNMEQHTARWTDISQVRKAWDREISGAMDSIADELTEAGLKVTQLVVCGIPFDSILQAEDEEDVSLTVIGSHGKSNIEEMLLGSVSEKVIRKSQKPVIVIKR